MSERRANLEGKFEKAPSGSWKNIIRVTVGGKIHYITGTAKTKSEAAQKAKANLARKGFAFTTETDDKEEGMKTVETSFMEFFEKQSSGWQETTKRVRLDFYRLMILNKIGHLYVKDLNARVVNDMFSSWSEQYCNDNISKSYSFFIKYLKDRMKKGVINDFLLSI
ncbi:MAG: hypothetical protein K6G67_02410, partial [Lachnospiraceae bacterium]|nr:hypothetical protein [Lachnospiraceae bacterium]